MIKKILIGLTGKAGSGKSTIAQHLVDRHHFARISLADPIRNGIAAMFPIPTNCLIDRDLKEQPHSALCGKSPREAMQSLGTEWGRRMIGDNIWLHVAQHKIDYTRDIETIRGIVVDDIRFENEADWIRNQGCEIWHVIRTDNPNGTHIKHESENGVTCKNEIELHNTADIDSILSEVDRLIKIIYREVCHDAT